MTNKTRRIRNVYVVVSVALFFGASVVGVSPAAGGQSKDLLQWPLVTPENKPSTYWWWMGNAVNKETLEVLLEEYHKAGLGGTKIVPIYGAKGHENEYIDFLTPEWMDMLAFTAEVSKRLGMTVDLNASTGWNMGGPWVRFKDAAKRVVLETYTLQSGQRLDKPVKHIQEPFTNLKQQPRKPISANSLLHMETLYDVRYKRDLPLLSLMAYSEEGRVVALTEKVGKDGLLDWTAPDGEWKLYAVFMGTGGKTVERAAPGGVGWQIDYLSKAPLMRQMKQFEDAFSQAGLEMHELIRSFHDDSFEQYTDWTDDLFSRFEKLHGYDLQNHLPALFGEGPEEKVNRVKTDYRETVSHLIIQEHTIPWTEWAHEKGVLTVNQAPHGSPAHPLDNWGASDQPENTGANYLRFGGPARPDVFWMMASSAAHVTGKKIISQETATFMHGHFHNSLGEAKNKEIDKIFLNGSNRIYYHSTTYSPEEAPWPGWLYYAPVHFVPANTIWKDFWKLNSYVSRVSSFLQSGDPDNDVLVYFPVYDIWHYEKRWVRFPNPTKELETTATALLEGGITFDYISDQQILKTLYKDGKLITGGGNDYVAVVVPPVEFMPVQTLSYLTDLAEKGATIVFSGGLPRDVPGFGNLRERQRQFQKQVKRIHDFRMRRNTQGRILITAPAGEPILPEEVNVPRETMVKDGLKFVRRSYEKGFHYFIKNVSDHRISKFITLARDAGSATIFDPLRDIAGMATVRKDAEGRTEVFLQLEPEEACILRTFKGKMKGPRWKYEKELDGAHVITGWNVSFLEGGPVIPSGFSSAKPVTWTEKGSEEAKWFAGTAEYSSAFQRPSDVPGREWILDLGDVFHSARVEVNGQHVATLITAPFRVNITEALRPRKNDLKVGVTNLAANRIRYMEQNGIERPHFYNVDISFGAYGRLGVPSKWPVMESGLAGPVRLIPATAFDPLQE